MKTPAANEYSKLFYSTFRFWISWRKIRAWRWISGVEDRIVAINKNSTIWRKYVWKLKWIQINCFCAYWQIKKCRNCLLFNYPTQPQLIHYLKKLFHYSILSNPYQEEREGEEKEQKNDVRSFVYSDYFCGNLKTKHRKCRYVKKQETNTFEIIHDL